MSEEKLIFLFLYITTDFLNKCNSDILVKCIFSRPSRHHNTERRLLDYMKMLKRESFKHYNAQSSDCVNVLLCALFWGFMYVFSLHQCIIFAIYVAFWYLVFIDTAMFTVYTTSAVVTYCCLEFIPSNFTYKT